MLNAASYAKFFMFLNVLTIEQNVQLGAFIQCIRNLINYQTKGEEQVNV